MLTIDMIYDAQKVLNGLIHETPILPAPKICSNLYIKAENLQLTGAFKLRGASYKMSLLTEDEMKRGVIACSAGNHAQAVALAATKRGISSTICIPDIAPQFKIQGTKNYGGNVVLVPGVFDDAYNKALEIQKEKNLKFIAPFDDYDVIAGQGTIGLEILDDLPNVGAVVIPIGGGGLASGVAFAIKTLKPDCKVYGVQAAGAPSMFNSVKDHNITTLKSVSTIADGIAVKKPGDITFEICKNYVDEIVTVSDEEIASAILNLLENNKLVSEGAGASSVAAVMSGKIKCDSDKDICCIVSGGNIDMNILSKVITTSLTRDSRITEIVTQVVDKPGNLSSLLKLIGETGANIISLNHDKENEKSSVTSCVVKLVLETKGANHIKEIYDVLKKNNYVIYD